MDYHLPQIYSPRFAFEQVYPYMQFFTLVMRQAMSSMLPTGSDFLCRTRREAGMPQADKRLGMWMSILREPTGDKKLPHTIFNV